jgi:hypothetical protein
VNLRCRNCGSCEIIVGEAGRRAKCAQCGGESFVSSVNFPNGKVLVGHGPKHSTLTITAHPGVPYATAAKMWAEVHALIESTPGAFSR